MRWMLAEVFDKYAEAKTPDERVKILLKYNSYELRHVLRAAFHPKIKFLVNKVPYYRPLDVPDGMAGNTILQEVKRLYLFENGHPRTPPKFTQERREKILIQILESLEAREAVIFMNMLLKDLKIPNLDKDIVVRAFPELMAD